MKIALFNRQINDALEINVNTVELSPSVGNMAGLGPKREQTESPPLADAVAMNPQGQALIIKGSSNVFVNGKELGHIGSPCVVLDEVVAGSGSVYVNGIPVTRYKNLTKKLRKLADVSLNVFIGD